MANHQTNFLITVKEARIIDQDNNNLGIMSVSEAIVLAQEKEVDLVLVSDNPAVCKIMDYNKFMYEQKKREKEHRKPKHIDTIKEYKFKPCISVHDEKTKVRKIAESLSDGYRIKVSVFLRRRELRFKPTAIELVKRVYQTVTGNPVSSDNLKISDNMVFAMIQPSQKGVCSTSSPVQK